MRYTLEKECLGDPAKQAIFIVPGWAMPKECLSTLAKKLSEKFYVVLVNLPGVSLNPKLIDSSRIGPNYDIDALSEQLIAAAPKDAWWLGWSLGGMISSYVAARRSSGVKGLITIGMTPAFVQTDTWKKAIPAEVYEQFSELVKSDSKAGLSRFIALQTNGIEQKSTVRKQLNEWVNENTSSPLALLGGLRLLRSLDVRRELEILDIPSLHILGDKDELIDVTWLEDVENELYPLQANILKGFAHQPFLEDLSAFYPCVEQFIDAH